jgi:EmrB/QacA subfamily drug resistance transporter
MATLTAPKVQRRGAAMVLLCVAQFVDVVSAGIAIVALPTIQRDLDATLGQVQPVISGYALLFGALLLLGGRAADRYGRRRLFALGLFLFGAASLLCGLAPSPTVLVAGRALQGAAAAMVVPAALALVTSIFVEPVARRRALAAWTAAGAAGGVTGLFLGGVLTDAFGWRSIFLINLPVVALALLFAPRVLPERRDPGGERLDVVGGVTLTVGLGLLIHGAAEADRPDPDGWQRTVAWSVAALAVLTAFAVRERRAREPLIPRDVVSRPLAAACLVSFVNTATTSSAGTLVALQVQSVEGFSATATGLLLLPLTLAVLVGSPLGARLLALLGARATMTAGLAVIFVGMVTWAAASQAHSVPLVIAGNTLGGLGLGVAAVAATASGTAAVPLPRQGVAAGVINTATQLGWALGVAALVAVATVVTRAGGDGDVAAGNQAAFLVGAALAAGAAVAVNVLLRSRDGGGSAPPDPAGPAGLGRALARSRQASAG